MRIAGGVLIIIVSIFDFLAGAGFALLGGATAGGGGLMKAGVEQIMNDPKATPEQKAQAQAQLAQVEQASKSMNIGGGALVGYGFFLLVLGGLAIAAGVVLFMKKAAGFALLVGVLQLVAEGIGTWGLGWTIWRLLPILAGIFVIIGALSYKNQSSAPAPM